MRKREFQRGLLLSHPHTRKILRRQDAVELNKENELHVARHGLALPGLIKKKFKFGKAIKDLQSQSHLSESSFLETATRAGTDRGGNAPIYLSSDAPAMQTLVLESFPNDYVVIDGEPIPSWDVNQSSSAYSKVIADFEMLKMCDVIIGPVSSNYAATAARESNIVQAYLSRQLCGIFPLQQSLRTELSARRNAAIPTAPLFAEFCQPLTANKTIDMRYKSLLSTDM